VWNTRTWERLTTVGRRTKLTLSGTGESLPTPDDVERLAVDPTGRLAAIMRSKGAGRVEVWHLETCDERFAVETATVYPEFAWSPDDRHLAVSDGERGRLAVVDTTGRELSDATFPDQWVGPRRLHSRRRPDRHVSRTDAGRALELAHRQDRALPRHHARHRGAQPRR
jgi:hypothetical protein